MEETIYLGPSSNFKKFHCSQTESSVSSNEQKGKKGKNNKDVDMHEFVNPCTNELNEYLDYLENDLYNEAECANHYEDVMNGIENIYDNLSSGLELYNHYIYKVLKKNRRHGNNNRRNMNLDDVDDNIQLVKKSKNEEEIVNEIEIVEEDEELDEELDYMSDSSYEGEVREKKEKVFDDF